MPFSFGLAENDQYKLAEEYFKNNKYLEAKPIFEKLAIQGHPLAQYKIGVIYGHYLGKKQDLEKAQFWYRKAANNGVFSAQHDLGIMLMEGKKYVEAVKWFEEAGRNGIVMSQYNAGTLYMKIPEIQNTDKAYYWLKKAAENNNIDAQLNLGLLIEKGVEGNNIGEAIHWYKKAADAGAPAGMYKLAYIYQNGVGDIPTDQKKGEDYLNKANKATLKIGKQLLDEKQYQRSVDFLFPAAKRDIAEAQFMLGVIYSLKGKLYDEEQARNWLLKSAKNNYRLAQVVIAGMYFNGTIFKKDFEKANDWAKQSLTWLAQKASSGSAHQQFTLAEFYRLGIGVEQSKDNAKKWYKKAADNGDGDAQYHYAVMLIKDNGNKVNEEALMLLKSASTKGNESAKGLLDKLSSSAGN